MIDWLIESKKETKKQKEMFESNHLPHIRTVLYCIGYVSL